MPVSEENRRKRRHRLRRRFDELLDALGGSDEESVRKAASRLAEALPLSLAVEPKDGAGPGAAPAAAAAAPG